MENGIFVTKCHVRFLSRKRGGGNVTIYVSAEERGYSLWLAKNHGKEHPDAAVDNWTFLEGPDEQVVDFFHVCEHRSVVADQQPIGMTNTVVFCVTTPKVGYPGNPISPRQSDDEKRSIRELNFFQKYKRRMRYASLKGLGSGVPPTRCWSTSE